MLTAECLGSDLATRYKVYVVEEGMFLKLINFGSVAREPFVSVPIAPELPAGYQVINVVHDPFMRRFLFQVVHPSFPSVSDELNAQPEHVRLQWVPRVIVATDC